MTDFGISGKRTVRTDVVAVKVNLAQSEYLYYRLTVEGAEAVFEFGCEHRSMISQNDFTDHPKAEYEWDWGKKPEDRDAPRDTYGVDVLFLTATKYTLLAEHRDKDKKVIQVLKDIDYESQNPKDKFHETLSVYSK